MLCMIIGLHTELNVLSPGLAGDEFDGPECRVPSTAVPDDSRSFILVKSRKLLTTFR